MKKQPGENSLVSASEIRSFHSCPEFWRLSSVLKLKPSNDKALERGKRLHRNWTRADFYTAALIKLAVASIFIVAILYYLGIFR